MQTRITTPSRRRRYSLEFKQQVVAQCQPGVSVAGVALTNGLNANMLRRWIKRFRTGEAMSTEQIRLSLVPVHVTPAVAVQDDTIALTIRRDQVQMDIRWPISDAVHCAQWLGEWLK